MIFPAAVVGSGISARRLRDTPVPLSTPPSAGECSCSFLWRSSRERIIQDCRRQRERKKKKKGKEKKDEKPRRKTTNGGGDTRLGAGRKKRRKKWEARERERERRCRMKKEERRPERRSRGFRRRTPSLNRSDDLYYDGGNCRGIDLSRRCRRGRTSP